MARESGSLRSREFFSRGFGLASGYWFAKMVSFYYILLFFRGVIIISICRRTFKKVKQQSVQTMLNHNVSRFFLLKKNLSLEFFV